MAGAGLWQAWGSCGSYVSGAKKNGLRASSTEEELGHLCAGWACVDLGPLPGGSAVFEKEWQAAGSGDSATHTPTQRPAGPYQTAPRPLCFGRLSPVSCLELSLLIPRMFQVFPPPCAHTPPCPNALPCLVSCLLLPCSSPSAPWKPALPHPGSRGLLPDPSLTPSPCSLTPTPSSLTPPPSSLTPPPFSLTPVAFSPWQGPRARLPPHPQQTQHRPHWGLSDDTAGGKLCFPGLLPSFTSSQCSTWTQMPGGKRVLLYSLWERLLGSS